MLNSNLVENLKIHEKRWRLTLSIKKYSKLSGKEVFNDVYAFIYKMITTTL